MDLGPAPRLEFGVGLVDRDIDVAAQEAHGEPFLALAAIAALPDRADHVIGQVVIMPVGRFGDDLGEVRRHAGFLLQLAERRHQRVLTLVDAALWHLPRLQL